jgi:hypothetical protein
MTLLHGTEIVMEGDCPSIRRGSRAELTNATLPQVFGAAWGGQTNGNVFRCLTSPGRTDGFKVALHYFIGATAPSLWRGIDHSGGSSLHLEVLID